MKKTTITVILRIAFIAMAVLLPSAAVADEPISEESIAKETVVEETVAEGAMTETDEVPDSTAQVGRILSVEEIDVAADSIMAHYEAVWTDLSMQGKLQFDGLPMRVSVKVYMKRGESVIISARAPILGEVARVEIMGDSIVLVNKNSRSYHKLSLKGAAEMYPGIIADIQDILLGLPAIPGQGRITRELARQSEWIEVSEEQTIMYPGEHLQLPGAQSGLVLDSESMRLAAFAVMIASADLVVQTDYLYGPQGWTMALALFLKGKPLNGELQLSYPDYAPVPLLPTDLSNRYKEVSLKELLKF